METNQNHQSQREYVAPAFKSFLIKSQSIICQSNPNEVPDMDEGWTLNF